MSHANPFDDNNPWHVHFFVMLEARCVDCGALGETDDLHASSLKRRKDGALEQFCVLAAERLQQQGWRIIDERGVFRCPECCRRKSNYDPRKEWPICSLVPGGGDA